MLKEWSHRLYGVFLLSILAVIAMVSTLTISNFVRAEDVFFDKPPFPRTHYEFECIELNCRNTTFVECLQGIFRCQENKLTLWKTNHEITDYGKKLNNLWGLVEMYKLNGDSFMTFVERLYITLGFFVALLISTVIGSMIRARR
jgi:hypothetical protein